MYVSCHSSKALQLIVIQHSTVKYSCMIDIEHLFASDVNFIRSDNVLFVVSGERLMLLAIIHGNGENK